MQAKYTSGPSCVLVPLATKFGLWNHIGLDPDGSSVGDSDIEIAGTTPKGGPRKGGRRGNSRIHS